MLKTAEMEPSSKSNRSGKCMRQPKANSDSIPPGGPTLKMSAVKEKAESLCKVPDPPYAVRLVDEEEVILFPDCESLALQLGCPVDQSLKVIAIVGNTGDGKSHTLNHAFCSGVEVFSTQASQQTCTLGVWAAYVPDKNYLLIDTEGLLGASSNQNRQRRLLLKVFALADIVIYRTMACRLHSDMFHFLADASDSFAQHFRPDLEALARRLNLPWSARELGPAVVVFHETRFTQPLQDTAPEDAQPDKDFTSRTLRQRLTDMKRNTDAFSSLEYVGVQTPHPPTDFTLLQETVVRLCGDDSVRTSRQLHHVFTGLQSLNDRFSTAIPSEDQLNFVEEYFTCPVTCSSCGVRCRLGVSHLADNKPHLARAAENGEASCCRYDSNLQNKLYYCKLCYARGTRTLMLPKTAESVLTAWRYLYHGFTLECPEHGEVYRSRAHWYGNPDPESNCNVHWEVVHLWPGDKSVLQGLLPLGQVLLDGLATVSNQVTQLTAPPVRFVTDLITDSTAPENWQPNASIVHCAVCQFKFPNTSQCDAEDALRPSVKQPPDLASSRLSDADASETVRPVIRDIAKHHCRFCGKGVCGACSTRTLPHPGFDARPVRICDTCYKNYQQQHTGGKAKVKSSDQASFDLPTNFEGVNFTRRKALEMCSATVSAVPPVLDRVKDTIKSMARPQYWKPDELCQICAVCQQPFDSLRRIHHCRACGEGVCAPCSAYKQPVPARGLELPHRVCKLCYQQSKSAGPL